MQKFVKFMSCRYGVDELYKVSMYLYFILLIINTFINSQIISIIELLIIFSMFYRAFSKDIYRRQKENQKYLELKRKIFNRNKKTHSDYLYKKCHKCHKTLKLPVPSERGIKHVVCPNCKKRNTYLIMKKIKVEIIK